jgi:hypothetical protein
VWYHFVVDALPASVERLLWDVDAAGIDLRRDKALVMERVMSRGTWGAMKWLRSFYTPAELAEFVRREGARKLSPRDRAYWGLVTGVELPSSPGGGRPSWAG